MKLIKACNEILYKSDYKWCSQNDFLAKLASVEIEVTSQTLRNWETHNLLTLPRRVGQAKGLRVEYCEFALVEAFAAYCLTNSVLTVDMNGEKIPFPKYSLLHIELARRTFCKAKYNVANFPKPPLASYEIGYKWHNPEPIFTNLPNFNFKVENGEVKMTLPLNMGNDVEGLTEYLFFQSLYNTWYMAIKKGCEKLLRDYERK